MGALFLYVTCEFFLAIRGGPYMTPLPRDPIASTWVNATQPGHIFDGRVVGTTSTAVNGDVSVDVRGTGNGFAPRLNNVIGAVLFGVVLPVETYINVKYNEWTQ